MVIVDDLELFISYEQFEELSKVLDYPTFDFTDKQKEAFTSLLSAITTLVEITTGVDKIKEDPQDNRILECAMVADADFIISGDEHLLSVKKLGRTKIKSAATF